MQVPSELSVEIVFERRDGNHYHVHSPDILGLHLAGRNLEEINKLLPTAIKDLFWFNSDMVIDHIRWVPSPAYINKKIDETPPAVEKKTYVMEVKPAA
jgi:predicted RNase H-like HicB family nuclease